MLPIANIKDMFSHDKVYIRRKAFSDQSNKNPQDNNFGIYPKL